VPRLRSFLASFTVAACLQAPARIAAAGAVNERGAWRPVADTVAPARPTVTIASGAAHTTSLTASIALDLADPDRDAAEVRFSANVATWSPWQPFAAKVAHDLSTHGGNTGEGVKTVYVQARDRAGNVGPAGSDSIAYLRLPAIGSVTPASLPNVTDGAFRLTGTDFLGVTEVGFGAVAITSTCVDAWHTGFYRVLSDTELDLHPPQGLADGRHAISLRNRAGTSNPRSVILVFPAAPVLRTHPTLSAGQPQVLFTSSGPGIGAFVSFLCLSPSDLPSVLPGTVSLEIGGGFTRLALLSLPFAHDPHTRTATLGPFPTLTSMAGTTLHFEALTFLAPVLPLPTTDACRTVYR
jgi:hypothetical protein